MSDRTADYEVVVLWSGEDQAFLAEVRDLPGCTAHGASELEARQQAQVAVDLWLEAEGVRRPDTEPASRKHEIVCPAKCRGERDCTNAHDAGTVLA